MIMGTVYYVDLVIYSKSSSKYEVNILIINEGEAKKLHGLWARINKLMKNKRELIENLPENERERMEMITGSEEEISYLSKLKLPKTHKLILEHSLQITRLSKQYREIRKGKRMANISTSNFSYKIGDAIRTLPAGEIIYM